MVSQHGANVPSRLLGDWVRFPGSPPNFESLGVGRILAGRACL
jgi:hypothetical protein